MNEIVSILRSWCFERRSAVGAGIPVATVVSEIKKYGLGHLGHYFENAALPSNEANCWGEEFRQNSIRDLLQRGAFKLLDKSFQNAGIRFCPIKGADLSWRAYPDGALRSKVDIDILVHPDDLSAAYELAKKDGWHCESEYHSEHHLPALSRNGVMLELHRSLPDFVECQAADIWKYLVMAEGSLYRMPKELNLAMLVNHTACDQWLDGPKLLLDMGYLLQHEGLAVNWRKMADLIENLKIPVTPAWVIGGFPDFFPEECRAGIGLDDEKGFAAVRQLILEDALGGYGAPSDVIMSDARRFSLRWWKVRLYRLSPAAMRYKTNNPRGHYLRLLWGYAVDISRKVYLFFKLLGGTRNVRLKGRSERMDYLRSKH